MDVIDLLTQETIEINQRNWLHRVPAHRYQDFAVHKPHGADLLTMDWRITHLPTGRQCAGGFRTFEPAVAAMVEISRLRNDWAVIGDEDLTDDLAGKCNAIAEKHSGLVRRRKDALPRRPEFNGYQPER